jgi:ATP-dependent Clp protease ATP-binding subunit ClpC
MADGGTPEAQLLYCHFPPGWAAPRSVLRELWERRPDTRAAFARAGIFVIEFEAGSVDEPWETTGEVEESARHAFDSCRPPAGARVLYLAHAHSAGYRELAAKSLAWPGGALLGVCGYIEGGIDFQGADGTFIRSDDWEAAGRYALRVAGEPERKQEPRPDRSRALTPAAVVVLQGAGVEANARHGSQTGVEDLFLALCDFGGPEPARALLDDDGDDDEQVHAEWKGFRKALASVGFDPGQVAVRLRGLLSEAGAGARSDAAWPLVEAAHDELPGDPSIDIALLWWVALNARSARLDRTLKDLGLSRSELAFAYSAAPEPEPPPRRVAPPTPLPPSAPPPRAPEPAPPTPPPPVALPTDELAVYGRDLTALAAAGKLLPIFGRDDELKQIARILLRATRSNPLVVGEAGVGKTALVEGLAVRLLAPGIPDALRGLRVVEISLGELVAGADTRGVLEERVRQLLAAAERRPEVVFFLDEVHALVGAGAARGGLDVSTMLKPALARGSVRCIGATTPAEYKRSIEADPALARRFQPVWIEEPSREEALAMLAGVKPRLEKHHGLAIEPAALDRAVDLSIRYLPEARLPDKAVDLLDQACTRVLLSSFSKPTDRPLVVGGEDVAEVVAERCRVPVERLTADEAKRLLALEEHLGRRIVGQDEAVRAVAQAVRTARAGVRDPRRPLAVFLFLGPTGTGKTETAKALAEFLFGDERQMLRFDMSEYKEKHSVSRLVGAPPGYVGHGEGGLLTDAVRRRPYAVVLFDEIEKAHPEVLDLLLQVLDEGQLTDTEGRVARFHDTVVVMTSNLGATTPAERRPMGFAAGPGGEPADAKAELEARVRAAVAAALRPELVNRIQRQVVFGPLGGEALQGILDRILLRLNATLAGRGVRVELDDDARALVLSVGVTPDQGARALERAVHDLVEVPLSQLMLEGAVGRVRMRADGGRLVAAQE